MADLKVQMNRYNLSDNSYDKLNPIPASHGETHASDGLDPITPQSIGAQPADTAINTSNIGSQSVDHANTANTANTAGNVSGIVAIANGGTGRNSSPSMLTNLGSTAADTILKASPRPGVTGTLPVTNGGTGLTAQPSMLVNLSSTAADTVFKTSPRPGVTGVLPIARGGTGASNAAQALANLGYVAPVFTPKAAINGTLTITRGNRESTKLNSLSFSKDDFRILNGAQFTFKPQIAPQNLSHYVRLEKYVNNAWQTQKDWIVPTYNLTGAFSIKLEFVQYADRPEPTFLDGVDYLVVYKKEKPYSISGSSTNVLEINDTTIALNGTNAPQNFRFRVFTEMISSSNTDVNISVQGVIY